MQRYASLRQGLVGCWCPSVSGPFGYRLPDLSGYGNHGTLTNMDPGTDWVASGGKGALDFDGSNDYVGVGNKSNLDFKDGNCAITFWAYIGAFAGVQVNNPQVVYKGTGNIGYDVRAFSYYGSNYIQCNFAVSGTQNDTNISPLSVNVWYHCAFVVNGSNRYAYKNGIVVDSRSHTKGTIASESYSFSIGSNGGGSAGFLTGQLDDIRIYNRALSESEIRLLASGRGVGLIPERQRNRYLLPSTRNRSSRFLSFPA